MSPPGWLPWLARGARGTVSRYGMIEPALEARSTARPVCLLAVVRRSVARQRRREPHIRRDLPVAVRLARHPGGGPGPQAAGLLAGLVGVDAPS